MVAALPLIGAGLAATAALGAYSMVEARWYRLRRLVLPDVLRRPGATLRVLHVSDVHLAHGQDHRVRFLRSLAELERTSPSSRATCSGTSASRTSRPTPSPT
jgi:hypothetical protein